MGHHLEAFIARLEVLQEGLKYPGAAPVIPLAQGFGLLPLTDALEKALGDGGVSENPYAEFWRLSAPLAGLGKEISEAGRVAYVETDYFGGSGNQAAILWEAGEVIGPPYQARIGAINQVLARMGVDKGDATDRFEALGLDRFRSNAEWIESVQESVPDVSPEVEQIAAVAPEIPAKNPILPPTYWMGSIIAMLALHYFLPVIEMIDVPWNWVGIFPILAGLMLNLSADRAFKVARTTVKPFQTSTALVTGGVFRISRHPMYLGMALSLLGLALLLGSLFPFLVVLVFSLIMEYVFIRTEEKMLRETFGEAYAAYADRVRKWI